VVYVLEVNPRASRTVPYVSKAIGVPLAKVAARVMAGEKLADIGFTEPRTPQHVAVKEAVFPFEKFPGVDTVLGPEMKSTGEVMGLADSFDLAFAKAQEGAGTFLPNPNTLRPGQKVFISVKDDDKPNVYLPAKRLIELGFNLCATRGTASYLQSKGVAVEVVNKVKEGRPDIVDRMKSGDVALVFNTIRDKHAQADSFSIRRTALMSRIPYFTTVAGMKAAVSAIAAMMVNGFHCKALQDYHSEG
ncbi:MAG: carbamoyl phosphate synthase large subunit, partial [Magnetococcales bacterium]|nr:carbamoyl phosphate synthase large subunit [Magnetococcales bacterium]